MRVAALLLAAYLLGSIPTSLWLARYAKQIDLREFGSGNLGATNLFRAAGAGYAAVAMTVDLGKGFLPAWLFARLDGVAAPQLALAYGVAAVFGHVFSLWAGFRGGKGVATGGGVYLALAPAAVGLGAVVWLGVMLGVRIASAASLTASAALPLLIWVTRRQLDFVFWSALPLAALIWWTHRSNLRRLLAGNEPRVARASGAAVERTRKHSGSTSEA